MRKPLMHVLIVILGGSLVGLAGCATTTAKTSPQAFQQTVKDTWVRYSNLWMAGDIDQWIQLWDDGGVQLPPNSPMKMNVAEIEIVSGRLVCAERG